MSIVCMYDCIMTSMKYNMFKPKSQMYKRGDFEHATLQWKQRFKTSLFIIYKSVFI